MVASVALAAGFLAELAFGFFVAAVFLLQTESRGALVAAVAGLALVVGGSGFNRLNTLKGRLKPGVSFFVRAASSAAVLFLLLVYSQQLGVNDRMAALSSGDESANVRVALYSAGLQMLADAPGGVGLGEGWNRYMQWYQSVGDGRSYLSLVNSHLTWLAEGGRWFRLFYLAVWCGVFLLCWPVPWSALRASAFAVWVTLGLCGFFSSVLTLLWLWIAPVGLLLFCLRERYQSSLWPAKRQWLLVSAGAVVGLVGLHLAGHVLSGGDRLVIRPGSVVIGEWPERVAVIQPDGGILGDKYGHTIRGYLDSLGGCTVLHGEPVGEHLHGYERIVLSGSASLAGLGGFKGQLVWMNPPADVDAGMLELLEGRSLTVVLGSLGGWRRLRAWHSLVAGHRVN